MGFYDLFRDRIGPAMMQRLGSETVVYTSRNGAVSGDIQVIALVEQRAYMQETEGSHEERMPEFHVELSTVLALVGRAPEAGDVVTRQTVQYVVMEVVSFDDFAATLRCYRREERARVASDEDRERLR